MQKRLITATVVAFAMLVAAPASADWDVNDPHKMHFPQLPDPDGWDVDVTVPMLADDFQCSQTGLITDVHFWTSWVGDRIPPDPEGLQGITTIFLGIFDNVPDPNPSDPNTYSMPGPGLWAYDAMRDFTVRPAGASPQGWYEPAFGQYQPDDHVQYFQYNIIIPEDEAFEQQDGNIYWLGIRVMVSPEFIMDDYRIGWKTSKDHWEDDAVWSDFGQTWSELRDPITGESLDMAFVITPEPGSLGLLALGAFALLRRR